jgi:hypothetical protein
MKGTSGGAKYIKHRKRWQNILNVTPFGCDKPTK